MTDPVIKLLNLRDLFPEAPLPVLALFSLLPPRGQPFPDREKFMAAAEAVIDLVFQGRTEK
jgi:hypothetical protein